MISVASPMAWLAGLRRRRQAHRMRRLVDICGDGTELAGSLDRRAAGARCEIGADCLIQGALVLERPESIIRIGHRSSIGGGTILDCAQLIEIGDDTMISYQCLLADSDNHSIYAEERRDDVVRWKNERRHDWSRVEMRPIVIGSRCWIGARALILKGVRIGDGAIVGAGSVVTREVPPWSVVAGNPARIVRTVPARRPGT